MLASINMTSQAGASEFELGVLELGLQTVDLRLAERIAVEHSDTLVPLYSVSLFDEEFRDHRSASRWTGDANDSAFGLDSPQCGDRSFF